MKNLSKTFYFCLCPDEFIYHKDKFIYYMKLNTPGLRCGDKVEITTKDYTYDINYISRDNELIVVVKIKPFKLARIKVVIK